MTHETPQQIAVARSKKLTECIEQIRSLENRELQARCSWAYICVQLGEQFFKAKEIWKDSDKNGDRLWKTWVANHSTHSYRSIAVYMSMYRAYDAANEVQKTALLNAGTVSGFMDEAAKQLGNEEAPRVVEPYLRVIFQLGRIKDNLHKFTFPEESLVTLRENVEPIARKLWPDKFGEESKVIEV